MEVIFSKEIRDGLSAAKRARQRKASRLRILADGQMYPVLRHWDNGFAVATEDAPHLRGLVDLYDGARHLFQCLIVAQSLEDGEMHYAFKRATAVSDNAPIDFVRRPEAPAGLITDQSARG